MECIDREALLTHLRECKETSTGSVLAAAVITAIQSFVEEMPVVEAAPPTPEHWIEHDDFLGRTVECSACHSETMGETPYCPVCGAKMDEKDGIRQETRAEDCSERPHEKRSKMSWRQIWESKVGSAEVLEKSMSKKGRDYGEYFNVNQEASGD